MLSLKAENISKKYRLGQVGTGTLSHDLNRFWHTIRGKEDPYLKIGDTNDRTSKGKSEYVWALQDVDFEIEQGDAVGIIGKNGAGKSTLLKILSKITRPTTGKIFSNGRISSLLEVGTGFHPEMTGRENVYLNGAILGMTKKEITRKFDEIVDFSGVEKYIDTPVKRYSSGMYVRLAFAVAAHLESEILIVDEVLAVGDAEFQKKCLGKMGDMSNTEGRTVLFVSHNMSAVQNLCNKGMLVENGKVSYKGPIEKVVKNYSKLFLLNTSDIIWEGTKTAINKEIEIFKVEVEKNAGVEINNNEEIICNVYFRNLQILSNELYRIMFVLKTDDDIPILFSGFFIENKNKGSYRLKIQIPKNTLSNANFIVSLRVDIPNNRVVVKQYDYVKFFVNVAEHNFGVLSTNEPGGFFHIPLKSIFIANP